MSDETGAQNEAGGARRWLVILPLVLFVALSGVFLMQLLSGEDASIVPSVLIGTEAPETDLPPLEGVDLPGFSTQALKGKVSLVNVWASWCVPCRQEHPLLMELQKDGRFELVGLNYKDKPAQARSFLSDLGNPFTMLGVDQTGRAAINWGVYGVPETYLVGRNGTILWKQTGPFTPEVIRDRLMPEIEKALAAQ
ncbi:DsbE family thiol:disulfide interchange protein [Zhengella mangrovi]|uniref:DsbE family thiol:disulfide interchange protein n=1 Tax=Zhengella mangrovi TaxID=1982044 RepID=A0A2G1QSV7_9HYPH|nr:DsbE family thiol:disulfide interchange protein [Zhengella mangrovi]PHP68559.1 DsbE family thiol:disulfide interchange protein [Zhengella mangrovi]